MLEMLRDIIWSFPLLLFLIGFGCYLCFLVRGYPILNLRWIWSVTFGKLNKRSLSFFSVALGGTMGVGNIIGASSCVLLFGAGSLFWMWVSAVLGMFIKYSEIVMAMKFRKKFGLEFVGGPMMNMEDGLKMKWMGCLYAWLCICTSFGIGNMVPMNALVNMFVYRLDVSIVALVFVLSVVVGFILFKGKAMIEKVCLYMVPFMSMLFIGACLVIVVLNFSKLSSVLVSIVDDVFRPTSIIGGVFWTQLQMGMARGIYSNEAGMGTSSLVHVKNESVACEQGAWGIIEVGMDTILSCTLSAMVVLLLRESIVFTDVYQALYACFQYSFGILGDGVYFISMLFFAMSGMLAWCYYADVCLMYLGIKRWWYPISFIVVLIVCSFVSTDEIWALTDILNGCMLLLNVSSMLGLSDIVVKSLNNYFHSNGNHVK